MEKIGLLPEVDIEEITNYKIVLNEFFKQLNMGDYVGDYIYSDKVTIRGKDRDKDSLNCNKDWGLNVWVVL